MRFRRLLISAGLIWAVISAGMATDSAAAPEETPFRMSVSNSLMTELNREDVRAVLIALMKTVVSKRGIPMDPEPYMMDSVEAMAEFGRTHTVDMFCLLTSEFWELRQELAFNSFFAVVRNGGITEEYVLVVRRESGVERLDQLKNCDLRVLNGMRSILARTWLDTVLMSSGLETTDGFFGTVTSDINPNKVTLPVFFEKADACLITRADFVLMDELNPQIGRRLKVIAASEPLIPWVLAMRAENTSPYRDVILDVMSKLSDLPAGRQILLLAHADRIEPYPLEYMEETMKLMDRYHRLCREDNSETGRVVEHERLPGETAEE